MSKQKDEFAESFLTEIREILNLPTVMDIVINKPNEIWAITTDKGWVKYPYERGTYDFLLSLIRMIANNSIKKVDKDSPIISAKLPNTDERVQIVMPPASLDISITIRKASPVVKSLKELDKEGAFNRLDNKKIDNSNHELLELLKEKNWVEFLSKAVKTKKNIIVSGQTGSGKTTFMKSLIMEIPKDERLITIEDVHELDLEFHENKVHLMYSRGEEISFKVTAKDALASCLRMRPSRILLAELRGDEAWEYIKSINTGHAGSITSMHANSAFESFEQLTAFIKDSNTGSHLDSEYIKERLFSTIDVILFFVDRQLDGIYFDPERKKAYLDGKGKNYKKEELKHV